MKRSKAAPAQKHSKQNDNTELLSAEDEAELDKLAGPVTTNKVRKKQSIFSSGCLIHNGISTDTSKSNEFVKKAILGYLKDMQKQTFVIGGDSRFFFPDVEIAGSTLSSPADKKYFSMIIPSSFAQNKKPYRYFLRKGEHKSDNESLIEIDEDSIDKLTEVYIKEFLPYLRSVEGKKINNLDELPPVPKQVVIKDSDAIKLIFKIDDLAESMVSKSRTSFNLSLREYENNVSRNTWFRTKRGITMSSLNFHNFIMGAIKIFGKFVHEMFKNIGNSFEETLAYYDPQAEESQMFDGEDEEREEDGSGALLTN